MMQVDTPLTIQVMAPPTSTNKTIYVRMQNVPGSVAIELTPAITSVFDIVQKFHELVFSKSYVAFIRASSLLGIRTDPATGAARETKITDVRALLDAEVLVYAPCDELRVLVEQGCLTPCLQAPRVPQSPTSSPSLKRKGRVSSVTSNVERVHRYGAELAKMDVSPREKALIEDLLIVGDEQVVDAMEQFVVNRNTASVRRVLRGPTSSPLKPQVPHHGTRNSEEEETLSFDFSSLDVHSPAMPAHANPFLVGDTNPFLAAAHTTTSFHPVTEQSSAFTVHASLNDPFAITSSASSSNARGRARPSLMFGEDELSSVFLPSIREKVTPPSQRQSLSLDDLEPPSAFDESGAPQLFSIAHVLDNVPVSRGFHDAYTVGNVLGSGKYSVVKACTHVASGTAYAVKIIDKRQMMEIKFLKRELEIMYGLRHDGVAQLIALYESNDELFLVLELCQQELFEYIDRNGPLSEPTARKLIRKLVATVAYLHDECIVHRDIKPENILIHGDGDVSDIKLTDFGIARKLDGTVMLTPHESLTEQLNNDTASTSSLSSSGGVRNRLARAHTKCGTRDYVAPEVMSGKGYGTEADLWSVGVVTYVVLSGCAPVFLPTADGTRKVFFSEDMWASMSDDVKRFIETLLVRNPEERATAADALQHAWLRAADEREAAEA
uniref:Protein kinase domain-containing protein n=1 Tax=Globisporangium ultimum (strain ATCC 200006 / CBS 805.95 / DAOM BR144) TaxID=431595 RepID=K3WTF6_GLOUD